MKSVGRNLSYPITHTPISPLLNKNEGFSLYRMQSKVKLSTRSPGITTGLEYILSFVLTLFLLLDLLWNCKTKETQTLRQAEM